MVCGTCQWTSIYAKNASVQGKVYLIKNRSDNAQRTKWNFHRAETIKKNILKKKKKDINSIENNMKPNNQIPHFYFINKMFIVMNPLLHSNTFCCL